MAAPAGGSTVTVRQSGIAAARWIKPLSDPVGNYIIQNRRAGAVPLHLVTVGAIGHSFSFTCQLRCPPSSGRRAADTSSVSGCHFVFEGSDHLHVKYNRSRCKHQKRFNKECFALLWPEKHFCHVLSTLILALARLQHLYSA